MTTWFTADPHLGDRNIIRYYDRRFESVGVMSRALNARWNEIVDDDDTVWVLGDFALGTIADTLPLAGELRGELILLTGNHDRCWAGHGRARGQLDRPLPGGRVRRSSTRHCDHRHRWHRGSPLPLPVLG